VGEVGQVRESPVEVAPVCNPSGSGVGVLPNYLLVPVTCAQTRLSGSFSWMGCVCGGGGQVYFVAAGCLEASGTTSTITRQPRSVMAGWARSCPAVEKTPEAECQWWVDRLGSRRAERGSAGASRLFYSPEAESSGERFRP
jgi:hypothetical protein